MKIKSIEPTPSPNTMKINLTEEMPAGKSNNYKKDEAEHAPQLIKDLLKIEGIKGIYHVADFLAVERNAKYDWKEILIDIRRVFGEETQESSQSAAIQEHYGEVNVLIQQFKGIPMQIKMNDGNSERRFALPDYFIKAIASVQNKDDNVVMQRKWKDYGVRYGDLEEIGQEVIEELVAAYPEERIHQLIATAQAVKGKNETVVKRPKIKLTSEIMDDESWERRYQALEQMEDPTVADIPILERALFDNKVSIRRLAVVYLGMIEDKLVLPGMYQALKDTSAAVRRTAGDCLSDLGFAEAWKRWQMH